MKIGFEQGLKRLKGQTDSNQVAGRMVSWTPLSVPLYVHCLSCHKLACNRIMQIIITSYFKNCILMRTLVYAGTLCRNKTAFVWSRTSLLRVCLYGCHSYPACKAHYTVRCGLSACTIFFIVSHKWRHFRQKTRRYWTQNVCFDFLYNFDLTHFSF